MSFVDDFSTPDSMQGVEPGRRYDPIYPPGNWGEPPPEMALPYDPHPGPEPAPIPSEPIPMVSPPPLSPQPAYWGE
jgi:hypothetical protein